jgi:cytochrome c5
MKRILLIGSVALLALGIACQSGKKDPAGDVDDVDVVDVVDEETPAVMVDHSEALDDEGFSMNAFPPMLPNTAEHDDAWLNDDCLLCHETGVSGAPIVKHHGMSEWLLKARCRSCHIVADPDAGPLTNLAGDELVTFNADAFPPTLPVDEDHRGAWLRDDCLACHQYGMRGAPKVRHTGMSPILLQARCRSCHVPGASSSLTDVPE